MTKLILLAKYAARSLGKRPELTLVVVVVIALGIGSVSAVFNVANASLLRPLPYPEPERIAVLSTDNPQRGVSFGRVSIPDYMDWRQRTRCWERLALASEESLILSGIVPPARLEAAAVNADFFGVFRVEMTLGGIAEEEWSKPSSRTAVLSDQLWRGRFGGDPGILGRTLVLGDQPYTVVGVAPAALDFPRSTQVWVPLDIHSQHSGAEARGGRYLLALGRLADNVTIDVAQKEMDGLSKQLSQEHPETNEGFETSLLPLHEELVGSLRPGLMILAAAVGLILLIVCANVAGLLLARGAARIAEMRLRFALGASPSSIAGQLLMESFFLAFAGGILGLAASGLGGRLLARSYPLEIPGAEQIGIHASTLLIALALALLACMLFGFVPALRTARRSSLAGLRDAAAERIGIGTRRVQSLIMTLQLAVTLALLIGAGLMLNTLTRLLAVDPGIRSDKVLTAQIALPSTRYPQPAQKAEFFRSLLQSIRANPEANSAAAATNLPLSGSNMLFRFSIENSPEPDPPLRANYRAVSPGYFQTLGVPLLAGREFDAGDEDGAMPVVIVNQAFVRSHLVGQAALGSRISIMFGKKEARRIVGVVSDLRHFGLGQEARPEMYVPFTQNPWPFMSIVVRTRKQPEEFIPILRSLVAARDRDQPIDRLRSMDAYLSDSLATPRFYGFLLSAFAALALVIALVGIYGLNSYWVRLRLREVGIRMAVGASVSAIRRLLLGKALRLSLIGCLLGAGLSLLLSRFLSGLLFGVAATDLWTFLSMSVLLVLCALFAAYMPIRRAAALDPLSVLRDE